MLLSFVVAPILAKNLEREPFGKVVRQLFPSYYGLGMGTAVTGFVAVNGLVAIQGTSAAFLTAGGLWLLVLMAESYCRLPLTPQSNAMRDRLKEQESRGAVDPALQIAGIDCSSAPSFSIRSCCSLVGLRLSVDV